MGAAEPGEGTGPPAEGLEADVGLREGVSAGGWAEDDARGLGQRRSGPRRRAKPGAGHARAERLVRATFALR